MTIEISPEPDETERRAILAALAADESEQPGDAAWARLERPRPGDEEPSEP